MLTNLVENNVIKCERYWPNNLNETEKYELYEVTYVEEQIFIDYIKRKLMLKNNFNNESKVVYQYYYPKWFDTDIPNNDLISLLHLIRDANMDNANTGDSPIVVHCSAGVGRTGTYITLDAMMEKINSEGTIDVFAFVSKIRERRQFLVQKVRQYIYIHEALNEYCFYGFTDMKKRDISRTISDLSEFESNYKSTSKEIEPNKLKVDVEFEKAPKIEFNFKTNKYLNNLPTNSVFNFIPQYKQTYKVGLDSANQEKNRNLDLVAYDFNRIILKSNSLTDYINATSLKVFYSLNFKFIITQDPLPNTAVDFLSMVNNMDSCMIVSLDKDFENVCQLKSCTSLFTFD
jgi:protein tyrosine phosphatase